MGSLLISYAVAVNGYGSKLQASKNGKTRLASFHLSKMWISRPPYAHFLNLSQFIFMAEDQVFLLGPLSLAKRRERKRPKLITRMFSYFSRREGPWKKQGETRVPNGTNEMDHL